MLFHIDPLRLWVHKVLPVVYDDSLSYYEVLAKVTKKLNEVIDLTDEQNQFIQNFSDNLTNAINNWEEGMEREWSSYKSGLNNEWANFQRNTEQYIENWKNMAESDIEDAIAAGINQFVSYFSNLTQTAVDAAEEAMRAAESAAEDAVDAVMPTLKSEFDERYAWKTAVGSPLVATTAAGMTDTTKVYVYAGSETGYVNGDWYYYDGTAWQDGGVYNSAAVVTDPTLSESGVPADAKATGDDITDLKSAIAQEQTSYIPCESGTYQDLNGKVKKANAYRIRNKLPISISDADSITIPAGYQAWIFRLTADMTYINEGPWRTNVVTLDSYKTEGAKYINIAFKKTGSESSDISADVDTVASGLTLTPTTNTIAENVETLSNDVNTLTFGNIPTKNKTVGARVSSSVAYTVTTIEVEAGRQYRIDMTNIDALEGASLYLRLRKIDDSGNAYTAPTISGDIAANTKWTYYFNCITTESVNVQIYRTNLTSEAVFSVGVACNDEQRDISALTTDVTHIGAKVDMEVSRNLIGPDLEVLYPVPLLKTGDIITASAFDPSAVTTWTQVRFHSSDRTQITYFQFDSSFATTGRRVTLDLGTSTAYFISLLHDCGSPLMVELGTKTDFIPHYTTNYEKYLNSNSNFGEFELFLPEQASIIRNNLAPARLSKRLCFGHISDNHSTVGEFISDIIDASDAKFIVNTGDIVQDKYTDPYTNVSAMINAMTKPYYITLGNHDVYQAPSITDIFDKYFAPIIDHNGQSSLDKTYYAVDFAEEKIKCIFLDLYDALSNYSASMETIIAGKMSATQINWLMTELDDALTNSMHVCIFLHLSPEIVGEREQKFFDVNTTESNKATYTFIPDLIDAFMDGTSVTFSYDGNSYTHTFASAGNFVGYFCGHMHSDCIGKLKTHNRQNAFSVARPWQSASVINADGTYRHGSSKWGFSTFNYVTIDPSTRHVSVMRVLQQETKYGFKRDFMTTEY